MSSFRRMAAVPIVLSALALVASGCGTSSGSSSANGVTTVKFVFWPGPESQAMSHVLSYYNSHQGKQDHVKIEQVLLGRSGSLSKIGAMISAHSSEVSGYLTTSYNVAQYANALVPLSQKVNFSRYIPSAVNSMKVRGQVYGVPTDVSNQFLYYRKDLIQKLLTDPAWKKKYAKISRQILGVSLQPKPPQDWNWKDYIATAAFFTQSYNSASPTKYGTILQGENLIYNVMIWDDVLWSYGGNWSNLDSSAAKKAMDVYATIWNHHLEPKSADVSEYPQTNSALLSGQAAFALQWSAAYPTLTSSTTDPHYARDWAIARIPGNVHRTHVHDLAISLNKYGPHQQKMLQFLKWFAQSPVATKIYAKNGGLPPVASVLNGMAKSHPEYPAIVTSLQKYGFSEPRTPKEMQILQTLASDLSGAWAGVEPVNQALKNAQTSVKGIS